VFHIMSCLKFLPVPVFHMTRCNVLTIDELYLLIEQADYKPLKVTGMLAPHVLEQMYGLESVKKHVYDVNRQPKNNK